MRRYSNERGRSYFRFLDRHLGIPLLLILSLFKTKRKQINNIKKIALLKTAAIGDTVLLTAIIKDILENIHDPHITLFTGASNYEIAQIISSETKINVTKLPIQHLISSIQLVRAEQFDLWLDFGSWPRFNAILSFFANANFKVGFKTPGQHRHYIYDAYTTHTDKVHELYNYKNILKTAGIEGRNLPNILLSSTQRKKEKTIVTHMFPGGSRSHLKEWPKQNWTSLINYLTEKGYHVIITGAKNDRERALNLATSCTNSESIEVVAGTTSLRELIYILQTSSLVISVDTGIMHIASSIGCNLISLHGPTSFERWGPLNKNSISLQGDIACSPCLQLGFERQCDNNKCMQSISAEQVIKATKYFL